MFYCRNNKTHYDDILRKVIRRLLVWQNKDLSFGGKYILINQVLKFIPIYMPSAMNHPNNIIDQLY